MSVLYRKSKRPYELVLIALPMADATSMTQITFQQYRGWHSHNHYMATFSHVAKIWVDGVLTVYAKNVSFVYNMWIISGSLMYFLSCSVLQMKTIWPYTNISMRWLWSLDPLGRTLSSSKVKAMFLLGLPDCTGRECAVFNISPPSDLFPMKAYLPSRQQPPSYAAQVAPPVPLLLVHPHKNVHGRGLFRPHMKKPICLLEVTPKPVSPSIATWSRPIKVHDS